jgi:3-oxoacyl-[acyl-carrier-protein] synthase-3
VDLHKDRHQERRIAEDGVGVSALCQAASERAMEAAGVKPSDIDLIILGTITPDTHCPAGANWLEARLGCDNAVSFDVTAACTGFIFSLHVASALLKARMNKVALVCAGEIMSRTVNWKERESCILWGDGAGAVVLTETSAGAEVFHSHPEEWQRTPMPGGGSLTTPISHESVDKGLLPKMINANTSLRTAVTTFRCGLEAVQQAGYTVHDTPDYFTRQTSDHEGLPENKILTAVYE